jgi:hypothetical protein
MKMPYLKAFSLFLAIRPGVLKSKVRMLASDVRPIMKDMREEGIGIK